MKQTGRKGLTGLRNIKNGQVKWENVIWSDESKFELFGGDGKRWVWRQPHEKYDVSCLVPTFKSGQQGVMVWGCFMKYRLGPLIKLEGESNGYSICRRTKKSFVTISRRLRRSGKLFFSIG
jgi:hypothetical protein